MKKQIQLFKTTNKKTPIGSVCTVATEMKTSAKRQKVNALNKSLIKNDEGINNTQLYLISHDNIFRYWTQNLIDGPLQASLNFIRLLRVVITPSVEKTTRSNRMNFRLITGMKRMDFKSYIPSFFGKHSFPYLTPPSPFSLTLTWNF